MNKLAFLSSLAAVAIALPVAPAQAQSRGSRGGGGAHFSGAGRSFSGGARGNWSHGVGTSRFSNGAAASRFRNGTAGSRWSNGRGHWNGNGRWGNNHWHGRHHYPRYYYSGFYPYYDPFYWGWYGPYWGSSVYYDGGYASGYGYSRAGRGNSDVVAGVQQELARSGYYRGSVDGVIGPRTRSAIRAYERANGLPVDGQIDPDLLSTMGVS